MQMANAMAIIANKGKYYLPHFVDSIQNETIEDTVFLGKYRKLHKPVNIPDSMFNYIIDGMHDVTVYGTSYFIKVPGQEYCAKTGTAQNPHGKNHSWFVGFAPKDDPKIAIAVIVENAGYGATWAGPIVGFMMEKYLNDTITTERLKDVERIANTDLIPADIKHWYYVKDSIRQAKAREVDENAQQVVPVIERKVTFDPEAEPNRKDSGTDTTKKGQQPMLKPDEIRLKRDSTR